MLYGNGAYDNYPALSPWSRPPWEEDETEDGEEPAFDDGIEPWEMREDD